MSGLTEAVKYLGRSAARVATDADLNQSLSLVDPLKYTKRTKSRALKKVPYVFYVPNTTSSLLGYFNNGRYIVFQYNYSFPSDFFLTKIPLFIYYLDELKNCDLCIRYRVGNTCYRYQLNAYNTGESGNPINTDFAPLYTNQLIKKNFVIECWVQFDSVLYTFVQIKNLTSTLGFKFETNLVRDPLTVDEVEVIGSVPTFVQSDLYIALPEDIPTLYPLSATGLDNV